MNSDYKNINQLSFVISFGRNMSRKYLVLLYKNPIKESISFSIWKNQNKEIVDPYENNSGLFNFICTLVLLELLMQADLIHGKIIISKE